MRTNRCDFCDEYENTKLVGDMEKEHGYTLYLRACLYSRSKTKEGAVHYEKHHKPMRLRYCPSCGKKLED